MESAPVVKSVPVALTANATPATPSKFRVFVQELATPEAQAGHFVVPKNTEDLRFV